MFHQIILYSNSHCQYTDAHFFLGATGGDYEEMRGAQIHRLEKKVLPAVLFVKY